MLINKLKYGVRIGTLTICSSVAIVGSSMESAAQNPCLPVAVGASTARGQNNYPIVLVGGFGVWGRDEAMGFKYWGGLVDLETEMTAAGYKTVTSAVGPVASYWDRACELYAQIKGTVVDYGAAHAAKYGHNRFGRDYHRNPLVPGWGDGVKKVHLLGHSMGGPTIRALATLLKYGSAEDSSEAKRDPQVDPNAGEPSLFEGGKDWVSGVMTISSPHDGTTLAHMAFPVVGGMDGVWVQRMVASWVSLWQGGNALYDFKLDQWNLTRDGKSWEEYAESVAQSSLWQSTKDISSWDGTVDGAVDFNTWAVDAPNVFYFSWATQATRKAWLSQRQLPILTMNPIWTISGFSLHMGTYTRGEAGSVPIDATWWENDGVVNTRSMMGPSLTKGIPSEVSAFQGTPKPGAWNYLGLLDGWDHSDIIGVTPASVKEWYIEQARLLASLPQ